MSIQDMDYIRTGRVVIRSIVTIPTEDLSIGMRLAYTFDGTHRVNTVIDVDRTDTLTIAWVSEEFGLTIATDTTTIEV